MKSRPWVVVVGSLSVGLGAAFLVGSTLTYFRLADEGRHIRAQRAAEFRTSAQRDGTVSGIKEWAAFLREDCDDQSAESYAKNCAPEVAEWVRTCIRATSGDEARCLLIWAGKE